MREDVIGYQIRGRQNSMPMASCVRIALFIAP